MALELSSGGQSVSPASSGRASPVSRKWRNQLGGDEPPNKDKAFRRYASGVDRSLSLFDTALQEWADYISFLGRLLKSLQAHPTNIAAVPSKAIVAKRLAQCLNPSLPSGVHQKALEVYGYIFSMIGKDELSKDLPLYLPGLSTTLSFASLSVRGPFLELLEKHLLKIDGRSLRPALKAIILALLPGLEEENSDEFERTLKLLDGFKHAVRPSGTEDLGENHSSGDEYFWQCFFLAAITSNGRRLGALAYLNRNLPKLGHSPPEQGNSSSNGSNKNDVTMNQSQLAEIVTSPEPGLLLRCFAAGLGDEQILIQRGFLDLLVTHLPLHSNVLQQRVKPEDLELLVTAAAGVVTRRDMSLNRRLWTWLLGPEPVGHDNETGPESPTSVSGDPLGSHASSRTHVRGYKSKASNKADFAEVLRSASVFFDGVESGLIWGEIVGLIAQALAPGKLLPEEQIDKLSLVTFIINHFNVREEEMLLIHAPLATLTILSMLEDAKERVQERAEKAIVTTEVETLALNLAMDFLDLIPERAFQVRPPTGQSVAKHDEDEIKALSNAHIIHSLETFYVQEQGNLDAFPPPFSIRDVSELLVRQGGSIARESLSSSVSSADAGVKTRLLVVLLSKVPRVRSLDVSGLLKSMQSKLSMSSQIPFLTFTSITSLCTSLYSNHYISLSQLSNLVDPLVRLAWSYLSASHPKYHVETVRNLWQLQTTLTLDNHDIEASICNLMIEHDLNGTYASRDADPGRSFSVLWTHSLQDNAGHLDRRSSNNETKNTPRLSGIGNYEVMLAKPLFLLLDALLDERTQLFMTVRIWLQSLVGIDRLFHLFVAKFSGYSFLYTKFEDAGTTAHHNMRVYSDEDDLDQSGRDDEITLLEFFLHVCLQAISGTYEPENSERKPHIHQFHRTALTLLHQILLSPYSLSLGELQLEHVLIQRLSHSLTGADPFIQVLLLDVVYAALKIRPVVNLPPPSPTLKKRSTTMTSTMTQHDNMSVASLSIEQSEHTGPFLPPPPPSLVKCLQAGFEAASSRSVLDSWVSFLTECLPLYSDTIFQILIPLVETLCSQIGETFTNLQTTFKEPGMISEGSAAPESTLISLLNGLEFVLAKGHDRLLKDETKAPVVKSPDQPQGFFGNMVSGVFTSETPQARSITANNRLTVLLSFQDAVRICFLIWSWGGQDGVQDSESTASFNYTSLRMRNRARRLLEHLFTAEALECLETLVEIGQRSTKGSDSRPTVIFNLLHVLDETNPSALDPSRKSTMTSSLSDTDLVTFLVEYARSLEDDAMDEIWVDCMTFLRDLLANPFPHRQTLPSLLEFAAILGVKVDNTNFGEQRRMRRELGDLFLRLLTAMFTTRPMGFSESVEKLTETDQRPSSSRPPARSDDVVGILASIAPNLPKILVENDRILSAANTISSSVIGPTFNSLGFLTLKSHGEKISEMHSTILVSLQNNISLIESDWLPLLRQWTLSDKERMPELLSRLVAPSTAGIVFWCRGNFGTLRGR
ncbi:hypothetical protein EYC84_002685 [Monilinia fructicola]|uniref:Uncharacterized protein n=1 Tax=Monilinia fructicola TaxID=38448 RepID=A0A5M9JU79_MONFR|nr:hypothetical protein EYC84_002685 [Monilinia fructicola]